jgi:4'-phosphopantetheinyl transferase
MSLSLPRITSAIAKCDLVIAVGDVKGISFNALFLSVLLKAFYAQVRYTYSYFSKIFCILHYKIRCAYPAIPLSLMTVANYPWLSAPKNLTLSSNDVHVWRINLAQSAAQIQSLTQTLSSDELIRAERFYFPHHQQSFIAGRGILRTILGFYLGIEPVKVQFDYQPRGKPFLTSIFDYSGICFNLSHSQGLGLCAVSYQRQIGIDIEHIRPVSDLDSLAKRFYLPSEYLMVRSQGDDQKSDIFFRYWTCKEAYLKATGEGLAQLEQVGVCWSLWELVPASNYRAAVVVAGDNCQLQCWEYGNQ